MRLPGAGIILSLGDMAFSLCQRQSRFGHAVRLSRAIQPLLRWASLYPLPPGVLDSELGHILFRTLERLTRCGIEFDPILTVHGAEALSQGGALLISGHFFLNFLFIRWLHDQRQSVNVVLLRAAERVGVLGTHDSVEIINPDAMSLIRIRRKVKAGSIVAIALDDPSPQEGRRRISLPSGTLFVSDKIFRFAERAGLPILFLATRLTSDGEIIAHVVRPSSARAAVVFDEFCQFLQAELSQCF